MLFNSGDTEIKQIAVASNGVIYASTFVAGPKSGPPSGSGSITTFDFTDGGRRQCGRRCGQGRFGGQSPIACGRGRQGRFVVGSTGVKSSLPGRLRPADRARASRRCLSCREGIWGRVLAASG